MTTHFGSKEIEIKNVYDCWCGRHCKNYRALRGHQITAHPEQTLPRCYKPEYFKWKRGVKCEICGIICTGLGALTRHKKVHPKPKNIKKKKKRRKTEAKCELCGKIYFSLGSNQSLRYHMKIMHGQKSIWECNICGKPCSDNKTLNDQKRTHLGRHEKDECGNVGGRKYLCTECGGLYPTKQSLQGHTEHIHRGKPYKKHEFTCSKCSKTFHSPEAYKRHLKQHEFEEKGIYLFSCKTCSKKETKAELQYHPPECPGEIHLRPFKCPLADCNRRFKLKHQVELHLFEVNKFNAEVAREMVYPGLGPRQFMIGKELKEAKRQRKK